LGKLVEDSFSGLHCQFQELVDEWHNPDIDRVCDTEIQPCLPMRFPGAGQVSRSAAKDFPDAGQELNV
jgi:hypothetical protein